jgi:glycosyltransferase involved in cell wall biosynthesis
MNHIYCKSKLLVSMVGSTHPQNIAIFHDRIPFIGGAEKFSFNAARALDAPIYTMYKEDGVKIPRDIDVHTIFDKKYKRGVSGFFFGLDTVVSKQMENLSLVLNSPNIGDELKNYDVIFGSGVLSKHYLPNEEQLIINYPHTPPRWMYDLYNNRISSFDNTVLRQMFSAYAKLWRLLDKEANDYVDQFVANSELVKNRIERYYNRDATVIYPPVTGDWRNEGDEGYFITWSRLVPNKRIDLIAKAFTKLDQELIICGEGPEHNKIQNISHNSENIQLMGFVDDIQSLVAKARAVVYAPINEDFGLVGAEALCAGKPLIGVNDGYTKYQINDNNGITFEATVMNLRESIREFDSTKYSAEIIAKQADKYSFDSFSKKINKEVKTCYNVN